jgi:hypothetical protein
MYAFAVAGLWAATFHHTYHAVRPFPAPDSCSLWWILQAIFRNAFVQPATLGDALSLVSLKRIPCG